MFNLTIIIKLKTEKYEHAKTRLSLMETKEKLESQSNEVEFLKNELEKERCAYANV